MTRVIGILIFVVGALPTFGQPAVDPPYRISRPADGIVCFNPGLETIPSTTCVIESNAGLMVVDTGLSPSMAERTRARIVAELGREDIRWVTNTHSHFDHSGGNQVFAAATIIGHDNTPAAMRAFFDGRDAWIERRFRWLGRQEAGASQAPAGSDQAIALEESLRFNRELIDDLRAGYVPTPPTLTFSDRITVYSGEVGIELLYFGRAHTDSDILVYVPSSKTLFTGDLFQEGMLGPSTYAGNLEPDRWLVALDFVLADEGGIDAVIGGHGLLFEPEWLAAQRRYLGEVWRKVGETKAEGKSLADLTNNLPFDDRFGFIADQLQLPVEELEEQNAVILRSLWRVGQASAADEIGRVARALGAEAAQARWAELRANDAFYIDERELNALGYQLLSGERKVPEALAVFEMNTQAFPESWNGWDSYAEAHWWIDDEAGVERNYRKALELNPEAESALRGISQIEGHRLDRAGETEMPIAHDAGAPTGLVGPFLGQEPPGNLPEVFAPGIVSSADGFEFSITFSPDGREIYFTRRIEPDGGNTLMVARWTEDGWTAPEPASFAAGMQANEPHITPDGSMLFFGSRPPEGPPPGIWVTGREGEGWGPPRFHGPGMNASSTLGGDLFMYSTGGGGPPGIVSYPKTDDGWGPAERLDGGVNQPRPGVHGHIAPDGSFIVFDSYQRQGAQGGEGDLFVAFRNADGGWGEAFNLGDEINTPATNFCPALSPDGKYLFFATNRDIYWVSAEVSGQLRPE
jgi:glyoxylase-like metal-dependent hydrolase (beta-lactamase superfamily II)